MFSQSVIGVDWEIYLSQAARRRRGEWRKVINPIFGVGRSDNPEFGATAPRSEGFAANRCPCVKYGFPAEV